MEKEKQKKAAKPKTITIHLRPEFLGTIREFMRRDGTFSSLDELTRISIMHYIQDNE
jgi:hypothetical protein